MKNAMTMAPVLPPKMNAAISQNQHIVNTPCKYWAAPAAPAADRQPG
jgi:hypothetical protein